jgi:hypothetical protein
MAVVCALGLPVVLMAQKTIEVRFQGELRLVGGYLATLLVGALLLTLAYIAWRRGASQPMQRNDDSRRAGAAVLILATGLWATNLWSDRLYGYTSVVQYGHALPLRVLLLAAWSVLAIAMWRAQAGGRGYALTLVGLVAATRISTLWVDPLNANGGDMLPTIGRSIAALLAGKFPYFDDPPPAMPYWPATLLCYLPPRALGCDLRWTNVVLETGAALVAMAPCFARGRRLRLTDCLLPLMMLTPIWTHYGTNTQYAPTVFVAVLLGQTLLRGGLAMQAAALGLAVAATQMFGLFGLCVGPWWWRQWGLRRAIVGTVLSLIVCLAWTAPFLLWDGREFLRVTLASLDPMTDAEMAGRLTLRPLLADIHPKLPLLLALATIGSAMLLHVRYRLTRAALVASLALALFLVLALLHRSFTHYYLPVLALMALAQQRAER